MIRRLNPKIRHVMNVAQLAEGEPAMPLPPPPVDANKYKVEVVTGNDCRRRLPNVYPSCALLVNGELYFTLEDVEEIHRHMTYDR